MNKGIKLATGDVVAILHSDDQFCDKNVVSDVMQIMSDKKVEFCFSDMVIHDCTEKGKKASLLWPFSVASLVEPDKYLKGLIDNGFCDISIADQGKIQTNQGDIESITISGKKPTR